MINVNQILKSKRINQLHTVHPQATVYEALELMAQHDVGALPVVEKNRLVGIFSERDYARKGILQGRASKNTPVRDLMSSHVTTVSPEFTVESCMWLMNNKRVRHLPVVRQGELVGLISIGDVMKAMLAQQAGILERIITPEGEFLDQ